MDKTIEELNNITIANENPNIDYQKLYIEIVEKAREGESKAKFILSFSSTILAFSLAMISSNLALTLKRK